MINFPIYPLRSYINKYTVDDIVIIETYYNTYILDNRNLEGETLAERRLHSKGNLYPLNNPIYTYQELVKSKYKEYIDKYGNIFKYVRTNFVAIHSCKIEKIEETDSNTYLVYTKEYKPLMYLGDYLIYFEYVLVMKTKHGPLIYGFSDEYIAPTRKKI